ncbi:MAG: DUF3761 domain-containing protein [Gammaproteobacteria bacterium]|nr:DUF3761 domain-containing protein [Gammaproteobacteria bacterium]
MAPTASAGKSNAAPAAPAGSVPAGATGLCKDGSYYTGVTKKGACRGHKGVKDWYAAATPAAAAPAPAAAAPAARTPAAPASAPPAGTTKAGYGPAAAAAAGGGSGLVWVNKDSKVYHCQGDRWYGTTKQGAYMSEANARVQGYRPDHGKACQN